MTLLKPESYIDTDLQYNLTAPVSHIKYLYTYTYACIYRKYVSFYVPITFSMYDFHKL